MNDSKRAGAAETALVRQETVRDVVGKFAMLTKSPERIDLNDTDKVKEVAERVVQRCAESGLLPSVELLAAALGHSRRNLYLFLANHPDSPSAQFIASWRTATVAMRIAATDKGAADSTLTIFLALNSAEGFSNAHQVEILPPSAPFGMDPTALEDLDKIVTALPDVDQQN